MIKVGINGLGRIGRGIVRAGFSNKNFQVVAINGLSGAKTKGHLLKYDSVHGQFPHEVKTTDTYIQIDGQKIPVLKYPYPSEIPWDQYDIDVVLECSGQFTEKDELKGHLKGSVKKVVVSAPASGADMTLVLGVNEKDYKKDEHHIISNASCTSNCLAPVMKVLNDSFKVKNAMMTTIHSYTNDQRILDLPHKDLRRARAAACSMIPTTTGASKSVVEVIPELKGKLTGLSVRVPTPCVSLVDVVVEVEESISVQKVNQKFEEASKKSLKNILGVSYEPLVSSDYIGDTRSAIVDAELTEVASDHMVKVIAWYDNETAFSHRMVELAEYVS